MVNVSSGDAALDGGVILASKKTYNFDSKNNNFDRFRQNVYGRWDFTVDERIVDLRKSYGKHLTVLAIFMAVWCGPLFFGYKYFREHFPYWVTVNDNWPSILLAAAILAILTYRGYWTKVAPFNEETPSKRKGFSRIYANSFIFSFLLSALISLPAVMILLSEHYLQCNSHGASLESWLKLCDSKLAFWYILIIVISHLIILELVFSPYVHDRKKLNVVVELNPPLQDDKVSTIIFPDETNTGFGKRHQKKVKSENVGFSHDIANLLVRLEYIFNQTGRPLDISLVGGSDQIWKFQASRRTLTSVNLPALLREINIWMPAIFATISAISYFSFSFFPSFPDTIPHYVFFVLPALITILPWATYVALIHRAKVEQLRVIMDCQNHTLQYNIDDSQMRFIVLTDQVKDEAPVRMVCEKLALINKETGCPIKIVAANKMTKSSRPTTSASV